jgi:hypothetical protein
MGTGTLLGLLMVPPSSFGESNQSPGAIFGMTMVASLELE